MSDWINIRDQEPALGQYLLACDFLGCSFPALYVGEGNFRMLYLTLSPADKTEKKEYWMWFPRTPGIKAMSEKEINQQ